MQLGVWRLVAAVVGEGAMVGAKRFSRGWRWKNNWVIPVLACFEKLFVPREQCEDVMYEEDGTVSVEIDSEKP